MASRRGLGSVISIANDDAAAVAAELRFAIDPITSAVCPSGQGNPYRDPCDS
jgi:hypothetical protein